VKVLSIRAEAKELALWKKAAELAGSHAGVKLSFSQWVRGRLNEAAAKETKKKAR
jgi:hypothetical protein